MIEEQNEPCSLCNRVGAVMSAHHLIPKSQGGIYTEVICSDCHSAIHARYTNKELAENFDTLENNPILLIDGLLSKETHGF